MTKVLYIEDNDDNVYMLKLHFEMLGGYEFSNAPDGEAGWEATRRLKADQATCRIPIIALTAHAMLGSREQALAAGCDEFDTKPINFHRLLTKISALLGTSN